MANDKNKALADYLKKIGRGVIQEKDLKEYDEVCDNNGNGLTGYEYLRKRYGLSSRVGKVSCKGCGKILEVPNMYSEKSRRLLQPYCPSTVMLHIQWLLHHGWHITKYEANPPGVFFCPDCFQKGEPEYKQLHEFDTWIEQAEAWMKENDGKQ